MGTELTSWTRGIEIHQLLHLIHIVILSLLIIICHPLCHAAALASAASLVTRSCLFCTVLEDLLSSRQTPVMPSSHAIKKTLPAQTTYFGCGAVEPKFCLCHM